MLVLVRMSHSTDRGEAGGAGVRCGPLWRSELQMAGAGEMSVMAAPGLVAVRM